MVNYNHFIFIHIICVYLSWFYMPSYVAKVWNAIRGSILEWRFWLLLLINLSCFICEFPVNKLRFSWKKSICWDIVSNFYPPLKFKKQSCGIRGVGLGVEIELIISESRFSQYFKFFFMWIFNSDSYIFGIRKCLPILKIKKFWNFLKFLEFLVFLS